MDSNALREMTMTRTVLSDLRVTDTLMVKAGARQRNWSMVWVVHCRRLQRRRRSSSTSDMDQIHLAPCSATCT
jgi:hypothetical protein